MIVVYFVKTIHVTLSWYLVETTEEQGRPLSGDLTSNVATSSTVSMNHFSPSSGVALGS